jgi:hypothetical protein
MGEHPALGLQKVTLLTKHFTGLWTWMDPLDKRPKQQHMEHKEFV